MIQWHPPSIGVVQKEERVYLHVITSCRMLLDFLKTWHPRSVHILQFLHKYGLCELVLIIFCVSTAHFDFLCAKNQQHRRICSVDAFGICHIKVFLSSHPQSHVHELHCHLVCTANILFIRMFIRKFYYKQNRPIFFMPFVHKLYLIPM